MAETIKIAGELESVATGGKVADVRNIKDGANGNKSQADINAETGDELAQHESRLNALTGQNYVSVTATAQTAVVTDVLPATGAADTIYRVGSWDGSQYDATKYSEYAWNGTLYVLLGVKSAIGEVYDISAATAVGGVLTKYADLAAALGVNGANVPEGVRKGGMSVKFVQSSDNKYVQYRLMSPTWSTVVANWQGVDNEPTEGSNNLVESNGVFASLENIRTEVHNFKKCYLTKPGWVSNNDGTLTPSTSYSYGEIAGLQQGDIIKIYSQLGYTGANIISAYNNGEYVSSKSVKGRTDAFNGYYEVPSDVNKIIIGCQGGVSNPYYFILYRKNEYGDFFYKNIIENHLVKNGYFYGNVGSKINIQNASSFRYAKIDITGFDNIGIGFDDQKAVGHYLNNSYQPVAITDEDDIILWKNADFVNYDSIDVSLYPSAKYLYLFIDTNTSNQIFTFNSIKDVIHKTNKKITSVNEEIKNIEEKTFSAEDFTTVGYINYDTGAIESASDAFRYIELNVNSGDLLDYFVYIPYNRGASLAFYRNGVYDKSISLPYGSYGGKLIIPSGVNMLRAQTVTYDAGIKAYLKIAKYVPADELYSKDETFFGGICKYTDFVVGRKSFLYFKNLGRCLSDVEKYFYFNFFSQSSPAYIKYSKQYLQCDSQTTGNTRVKFVKKENVYDDIDSCETTLRVVPKNTGSGETKNIIFIGDSLIANGLASEKAYNLLVEDADYTINLLGDHLTGSQVNAGHGSWSWETWTDPSGESTPKFGFLNPFYYNGELDFLHFMETNYPSLSGIDIAVISLGTNDMVLNGIECEQMQIYRAEKALEKAKLFVSALAEQYPNCKIIIGLPNGGGAEAGGGYDMYPSGFRCSINIYNKLFKDTFDDGNYLPNVTCVYHGWFIDNESDYNHTSIELPSGKTFTAYGDHIHPSTIGYQHWGVGYYNKIRAILAGLL